MLFSSPTCYLRFFGLPGDSPPIKALIKGVGIDLLTDFLLQPPSYYKDELTYVEKREDGSTALMALHPTYVALLMALYQWCHGIIGGNRIPPIWNGPICPGLSSTVTWKMYCGRLEMFLVLPSPSSECSLGLYLRSYQGPRSQFNLLKFLSRR